MDWIIAEVREQYSSALNSALAFHTVANLHLPLCVWLLKLHAFQQLLKVCYFVISHIKDPSNLTTGTD